MVNESLMTDRIRGLIGRRVTGQEGKILPVDKTAIRRYCEATDDLNPVYLDDEYARKMGYSGIIAPPTFFSIPFRACAGDFSPVPQGTENPHVAELMELLQLPRALDTAQETEYFIPIQCGDTLTYDKRIHNITEKRIKAGLALLVSVKTTVTNQRGELVCTDIQEWFFFR